MTDLDALRLKWPQVSPETRQKMMERLKACQPSKTNISETGCANVSATVNTAIGYK